MSTPDQVVAERIARVIDGQIHALEAERAMLEKAAERIAEIDAQLAILQSEKTRIDQRRPPRTDPGPIIDKPNPRSPRA